MESGIREVVRRRGWGYPSMLLLALAYGVFEEAVTTQSLFNPNYADLRLLDPGYIGFLGIGAPWTVFVVLIGLAARVGRAAVSGAAIGGRESASRVPAVWGVGLISLLVTSAFLLVSDLDLSGWLSFALYLAGWALSIVVVRLWSRRQGWTRRHVLALASGALVSYAWRAFPQQSLGDGSRAADLTGNVVFAVLAVVLLVVAWRRVDRVTPAAETAGRVAVGDERIRRDKFGYS